MGQLVRAVAAGRVAKKLFKTLQKVTVTVNPFDEQSTTAREFLARVRTRPVQVENPKLQVYVNYVEQPGTPTVDLVYHHLSHDGARTVAAIANPAAFPPQVSSIATSEYPGAPNHSNSMQSWSVRPSPQKRPRLEPLSALRSAVLPLLLTDTAKSHEPNETPPSSIPYHAHPLQLPSTLPSNRTEIALLYQNLACASRPEAAEQFTHLAQQIRARSHGRAHLTAIFRTSFEEEFPSVDVDDCDDISGPPLCTVVHLLRDSSLVLADIPHQALLAHVIFPLACVCPPSQPVRQLLRYVLDTPSAAARAFLNAVVDVFGASAASSTTIRFKRLWLITVLCEEIDSVAYADTLSSWIRQVVLPSRFMERAIRHSPFVTWTPELSGLATGRVAHEYLPAGEAEARALIALFQTVSVADAASVYSQAVSTLLVQVSSESDARADPVTGTWARLVLLGDRIPFHETIATETESESAAARRTLLASLTSALTAPACFADSASSAAFLALARRMLLPVNSLAESTSQNKPQHTALQQHEAWFRQLVTTGGVKLIEAILEPLTQLIPLEPLHLLKASHKVLVSRREFLHSASAYVAALRTRIQILDPAFHSSASPMLSAASKNDVSGSSSRALSDVVKFVLDFAKDGKKNVPLALIRQMNFHRYHFRRATLPVLVDPQLYRKCSNENNERVHLDEDVFENVRIELIRELAFRRKDQAISKAEGREALSAIREARDIRKKASSMNHERKDLPRVTLQEKKYSTLHDCLVIFLSSNPSSPGKSASQNSSSGPKGCQDLEKCLASLAGSLSGDQMSATVAADLLQALTLAIIEVEEKRCGGNMANGLLLEPDPKCQYYSTWWNTTGQALVRLIPFIFSERLAALQRYAQYQLLSLLCARIGVLSDETIIALCMLTTALTILQSNDSLAGLTYVAFVESHPKLRPVASVITDTLPVKTPSSVSSVTKFALVTIVLTTAYTDYSLFESTVTLADENRTQARDADTAARKVLVRALLDVLKWVACNPWRLYTEPLKYPKLPQNSNKVTYLLRAVTRFLSSDARLELDDRTCALHKFYALEMKSGWGHCRAVTNVMRKQKQLGYSVMSIVITTTSFLANCTTEQNESPTWIRDGLCHFYESESDSARELGDESVAAAVEQAVRNADVSTGLKVLEIFAEVDCCYFCNCPDVEKHVTEVLVSNFWVLPRRLVAYVLQSLSHCARSAIITNPFFIGNCARILGSSKFVTLRDRQGSNDSPWLLSSSIKDMLVALNDISLGTGAEGMQSQQHGALLSRPQTVRDVDSRAMGVSLALTLFTKFQQEDSVLDLNSRLTHCFDVLDRYIALEAFDFAFLTAAILRHTRPFSRGEIPQVVVMKLEQLLVALLQERVKQGPEDMPNWIPPLLDGQTSPSSGRGILPVSIENALLNPTLQGMCEITIFGVLNTVDVRTLEALLRMAQKQRSVDFLVSSIGKAFETCLSQHDRWTLQFKADLVGTLRKISGFFHFEDHELFWKVNCSTSTVRAELSALYSSL